MSGPVPDVPAGLMVRPIERMGSSSPWLRQRIAAAGVRLHPASDLARSLAHLDDMRDKAMHGELFSFPTTDDAYDFFARAVGADFLSKALHWGFECGLTLDAARWKHMTSGDPIVTKIGPHSNARNFTWEVIIASLASTFAQKVAFDEPDVCCSFQGNTFAVAAKVAYSEKNLFENVETGFAQANGKAEGTLVFVDVVNLYPVVENLRWSRGRHFGHNDEAVSIMKDSFTRWCARFDLATTAEKIRSRALHPVGIAFFAPMFIDMAGQPVPFFYTHLPLTWAGEAGADYEFAKAFLNACNTVLSFQPASMP